jgi:hypothetical protein
MTAVDIRAQVNLIQEVMKAVMIRDTHYGIVPGCPKPSLWKPGAEKLLVTFRIAPMEPKIEDLSTPELVRYRVTRGGQSILTGAFVGAGIGECSSDEMKYKWRKPVCDAEYDAMPENHRRLKYLADGKTWKQVKTEPADVANTILKMADKRALVSLALISTAASDIFTQDIEDLPEGVANESEVSAPVEPPKPKAHSNGEVISDAQAKRFYAKGKGAGKTDEEMKSYLKDVVGVDSSKMIPKSVYDSVCAWADEKSL